MKLMTVTADELVHSMLPYTDVIDGFRRGGRSMLPTE